MSQDFESFFSVGGKKVEGNPYEVGNLEKVKEEIEKNESLLNEAQTLDLGMVESVNALNGNGSTSTQTIELNPDNKIELPDSNPLLEGGNNPLIEVDLNSELNLDLDERPMSDSEFPFEVLTESSNGVVEINVNGNNSNPLLEEEVKVDTTLGLEKPIEVSNPLEEVDRQLSGISEKVNSKEIIENGSKATVTTAELSGDFKLNISDNSLTESKEEKHVDEVESISTDINKVSDNQTLANLMMDEDEMDEFHDYKSPSYSPPAKVSQSEEQAKTENQQPPVDLNKEVYKPVASTQSNVKEGIKENKQDNSQNLNLQSQEQNQNIINTDKGFKYRTDATYSKGNEHSLDLTKFSDGKEVSGDAFINTVSVATYQGNKKMLRYNLTIKDGEKINGTQFGIDANATNETFAELKNTVMNLTGKWNEYRGEKGINISFIGEAKSPRVNDYIAVEDMGFYSNKLNELINSIRRPWLRETLVSLLEEDGYLAYMKQTPAAVSMHDVGPNGLYLHTVKVSTLSNDMCKLYPQADSDVVNFSSIVHDIGKVVELKNGTYSDLGSLVGHIVLGYSIVRDKFNSMVAKGYPVESTVVMNILHCILSHHGQLEWGSPVTPKTIVAVILHQADSAEAKSTHFTGTFTGSETRKNSGMFKTDIFKL